MSSRGEQEGRWAPNAQSRLTREQRLHLDVMAGGRPFDSDSRPAIFCNAARGALPVGIFCILLHGGSRPVHPSLSRSRSRSRSMGESWGNPPRGGKMLSRPPSPITCHLSPTTYSITWLGYPKFTVDCGSRNRIYATNRIESNRIDKRQVCCSLTTIILAI